MKKPAWLILVISFLLTTSLPSFAIDLSSPAHFRLKPLYLKNHADNAADAAPQAPSSGSMAETERVSLYAQLDDTPEENGEEESEDLDYLDEEESVDEIADPFEPVNRVFFAVNDKLYFWILKPVAQGYSFVFPEPVRSSVRNFFDNIATPVRFVNSLLQFKFTRAGKELLGFGINSTVGVLGLFDVAGNHEEVHVSEDEDFGQTLGVWGLGPGFYMNLPILGPSSLRDAVGGAGDYFLDPVNYVNPLLDRYAIEAGRGVNKASFRIGDYEEIKKDAFDPYSAVRDIYHQYRKSKVSR